ncbi:MAG TPA: M56 family metallopeptidase, partial [Longimicrobiaceae bacterium]|nr:M56 family metallopeptidase [Longimicrobiaceae bacterium]
MAAIDLAGVLGSVGAVLPELSLKAALLLGAAGLLALALRRRSAAARHLVWTTAIAGVLALPLAQLLPLRVEVLPASLGGPNPQVQEIDFGPAAEPVLRADAPAAAALESTREPASPSLPSHAFEPQPPAARAWLPDGVGRGTLLVAVWLLGAGVLILRLLFGTATVWWLARTGERIEDEEWTAAADRISRGFDAPSARLVRSRWTEMPMTWGMLRPVVLLPASCDSWPAERRDVVLRHELAHVARRDVLTLALAQLACAVHWFNPLSWVALHQLRAEAERCCDDWVLSTGTRASTYADHLLEMVRIIGRARVPAAVALPMAQRSTFEGRLLAILEPGVERGAPGRRRAVLTVGGLAVLVAALGAMRPAD